MTFAWPLALLSLLVVPLLLGIYWWSQRRRRKQAVRYSSVALLRSVLPRRKRWQRHLPIALLLAGLVALGLAAGRPHVVRNVPIARTSIILALDVSRSMCSTDVEPNRLAVAQEAARAFVQKQPQGHPDGPRRLLRLRPAGRAADDRPQGARRGDRRPHDRARHRDRLGDAEGARRDRRGEPERRAGRRRARDRASGHRHDPASPPANGFVPDIVVLLTDGANNRGIEPLDAVPYAVERRVRVYPIGFGTANPSPLSCTREQLGGDVFDAGGFGGGGGGASAVGSAAAAAGSSSRTSRR